MRDWSGRRIAILGADGFIGSNLTCMALQTGAAVTGICARDPWRLHGVEAHLAADGRRCPALRLISVPHGRWWSEGFARELRALVRGVDALALLAYTPPDNGSPAQRSAHERTINAAGAGRIAEVAADADAVVVFASSADVYAPWHAVPVSEDTSPQPSTPYGNAKLEAERLVTRACSTSAGATCLRIATAYGPGEDRPRAIPAFIQAILRGERPVIHGDGWDVRDYVSVHDIAGAFLNACLATSPGENDDAILNIGSGLGRRTIDVLAAVADAMGVAPRARHEQSSRPPAQLVLATERARAAIGFVPNADFDTELKEEIDWLRQRVMDGRRLTTGAQPETGDR